MPEPITTKSIMEFVENSVEQKIPISPTRWLDAAQSLNVLVGDDIDNLYKLQKQIAQVKVEWIEQGKSVAESKLRAEATDDYEQACVLKGKIERIKELIRISKLQARLKDSELKGY